MIVGLDQFLSLFGDITITKIVTFGLACAFCWKVYTQIKKFFDKKKETLIKQHEAEQEKTEQLKLLTQEVNKYPEYREKSREIQKNFQDQIDILKESQDKIIETQQEVCVTLKELQDDLKKREKNKLQDRLLQSYRYYTDLTKNPERTWTVMESQAFWALFTDYEEAGGNGYMHSVVQPAMKMLTVVENK